MRRIMKESGQTMITIDKANVMEEDAETGVRFVEIKDPLRGKSLIYFAMVGDILASATPGDSYSIAKAEYERVVRKVKEGLNFNEERKIKVVRIKEDVQIGDIILEAGDKIQIIEGRFASVTVDIANDDGTPIAAWIKDLERKYRGLTGNVINMSGPGGGWPEVEISGDYDLLKSWFLSDYGDEDDFEEFLN